ncbi:hypothetical protein [Pantoea sp. App145]|uniref:hypothetical protein n=1 Tax=Pantoea sp. App145 TaxID=3071567 RepID=UPI003A810E26
MITDPFRGHGLKASGMLITTEDNEILWPRSVSSRQSLGKELIGKTCQIYRKGDLLIQNIVEGRITICLDEEGKVIDVFEEATLDEK